MALILAALASRCYFGREAQDAINLFRKQDNVATYSHFFYEGILADVRIRLLGGEYAKFTELKIGPADMHLGKGEIRAILRQIEGNEVFCPPTEEYTSENLSDRRNSNYNWSGNPALGNILKDPYDPLEIINNFEKVKVVIAALPLAEDGYTLFSIDFFGEQKEFMCFRRNAPIPAFPGCEGGEVDNTQREFIFHKPKCRP